MRTLSKVLTLSLSATIGALCTSASMGGAPLTLDNGKMVRAMALPNAGNHISPPIAGIRLLEVIFQRMHSLPQLAINKSKSVPIVAQSAANNGLTDPMLAIKPKEVYKSAQQKVAYAPQGHTYFEPSPGGAAESDRMYVDEEQSTQERKKDESAANRKAAPTKAVKKEQSRSYKAPRETQIIGERPIVRDFRQAPLGPPASQGYAPVPPVSLGKYVGQPTDGQYSANAPANVRGGVFDHPGFVSLQRSISRFAGAVGAMQNAQSSIDNVSLSAQPPGSPAPAMRSRNNLKRASNVDRSAPSAVTVSTQPQIQEFNSAAGKAQHLAAAPAQQSSEPLEAPPGGTTVAAAGGEPGRADATMRPPEAPAVYRTTHEYQQSGNTPKPLLQAMLVPNVINGIPLVKLGENESEAQSALGTVGSVSRQEYKNGWRVYSVSKTPSRETAAQLYVKHGMVEGMRVFDVSLMPGDLGVSLGDDLTSVKSKFGEPAFFISEPSLGRDAVSAGLNYVYPISQVSFQLARVTKKGTPQVVSMLLFTVK